MRHAKVKGNSSEARFLIHTKLHRNIWACVKQKKLCVCTLKLAFRVLDLILEYRGARTQGHKHHSHHTQQHAQRATHTHSRKHPHSRQHTYSRKHPHSRQHTHSGRQHPGILQSRSFLISPRQLRANSGQHHTSFLDTEDTDWHRTTSIVCSIVLSQGAAVV